MIYLIHGENYLENEAALTRLAADMAPLSIEAMSSKWADIREKIQSSSLFPQDRTLVVKQLFTSKQKAETFSEAIRIFNLLDPNETLILYELQTVEAKNPLFVWIQKNGKIIYNPKLTLQQVKKWILAYGSGKNVTVAPDAVTLLAEEFIRYPEGLKNELEKIFLFVADKNTVDVNDIVEITRISHEANIFELGDRIGERKASEALRALTALIDGGAATGYITVMLARHFRLLIKVKYAIQEKVKPNECADKLKIAPFLVSRLLTQAGNFSASELQSAYGNLILTDWEVKKGKKPAELALELWLEKVCLRHCADTATC